jgi:hypothetical protein
LWSIRSNLKAMGRPEEARLWLETAERTLERVEGAEQRVRDLLDERVG